MEHSAQTKESNGRIYISWHWLAITLVALVVSLSGLVWKMAQDVQAESVQSISTRVTNVETQTNNQGAQIQTIDGNIIRICNKLGISQCE